MFGTCGKSVAGYPRDILSGSESSRSFGPCGVRPCHRDARRSQKRSTGCRIRPGDRRHGKRGTYRTTFLTPASNQGGSFVDICRAYHVYLHGMDKHRKQERCRPSDAHSLASQHGMVRPTVFCHGLAAVAPRLCFHGYTRGAQHRYLVCVFRDMYFLGRLSFRPLWHWHLHLLRRIGHDHHLCAHG